MKAKFCPKCKNTDIVLVAGGIAGMYECKKCGFRGAIFPEKELNLKEKKKI
jgi:predicted nucleic-acid-binding Zn-ribbon protein